MGFGSDKKKDISSIEVKKIDPNSLKKVIMVPTLEFYPNDVMKFKGYKD